MADANHTDVATAEPIAAGGLVSGLKLFAAELRGARAVIAFVGRPGAILVLTWVVGYLGDVHWPASTV